MRRSADFSRTVRRGVRAGRPTMVVHHTELEAHNEPTMVGFVVSKAIGNAVTRNKVKRRLRGLIAINELIPTGSSIVVRALPPAAQATYGALQQDFNSCLDRTIRQLDRRGGGHRRGDD